MNKNTGNLNIMIIYKIAEFWLEKYPELREMHTIY